MRQAHSNVMSIFDAMILERTATRRASLEVVKFYASMKPDKNDTKVVAFV